ncbi:MAG: nucleoside deaminase [Nanoarchaeota archaeon]|nr:nucleoside deaminase [Nanoarchaeota archaeon]
MNKFMDLAIKEAKKAITKKHGGPFGAVIVKGNKVIAKAHSEVLKKKDPTAHAEILAIRKASKKLKDYKLKGCRIYSTAEPCSMCLSAILWAGIKQVYFGCTLDDTAKLGFNDKNFYKIIKSKSLDMKNIKRKECLKIFDDYNLELY